MSTETVKISRLGAQGDGVAQTETGHVYAAFTLPGETVTLAVDRTHGTLMSLKEASLSGSNRNVATSDPRASTALAAAVRCNTLPTNSITRSSAASSSMH